MHAGEEEEEEEEERRANYPLMTLARKEGKLTTSSAHAPTITKVVQELCLLKFIFSDEHCREEIHHQLCNQQLMHKCDK